MDINRKRKNDFPTNENYSNKRRPITNWNEMISASSIRNYILEDPLLDWLKYYSINNLNDIPKERTNINNYKYKNETISFNHFIMEQGNLFEKIVFDKLKELNNINIVQVSYNNESQSYEKYMETIDYMKQGIDIIYQGVLHDYKKKLYGVPDLLIRVDKFNEIFNKNLIIPTNKCLIDYHYVVVDIKHSTINLNCNQTFIRDTNSIPAYKGQILIYNRLLSNILGYEPKLGFIMSKKINYTKNNINYSSDNFMENISIIDYNGNDKNYKTIVNKAIEWIRRMRQDGYKWRLLPTPTTPELYPNMKNDKDDGYRLIKTDLANNINEITNIWWCSYKKRQLAHSKKVYKWNDRRFNAELIEIKDSKTAVTLNNILNINKNNHQIIRTNDLLKTDDWRYDNNVMEFFIDFETINSNIGQFEVDGNNIIFMICIGWENNNIENNWEYKTFMINKNDNDDELKMIENMWELINNKMVEFNKTDYTFIHWTSAEITFYNKFLSKHPFNNSINLNKFKSFDLYKLFLDNNVVVKGAFNFSLKNVANAMYKNGLIKTCWDKNSSCTNGLQAMFLAYNLYKNNAYVDDNNDIMKEIIRYNIIDCQVMWEMLSYLRINY
jgi:hypothetical protein